MFILKKMILALSLTAGVIGLSACSGTNGNSQTVAESKAGDVTKDELYNAMKDKVGEQALQELVYQKVLAKKYTVTDADVNKKVDEIKQQAGTNFEMILMQNNIKDEKELKKILKSQLLIEKAALKDVKATDKEMKDYYDNYKPEIKARHILVADENTAKELKAKIEAGAKFEDVAKESSTDTQSAKEGGDLGWFGAGKMQPEFEQAAYALNVNQISDPVKTQFGYHIIQVTDKKEKKSFEDMKKDIEYQVKAAKLDNDVIAKTMQREMKDAKVDIKDKDLKGVLGTDTKAASK
jgi:foldase protein PrsA